MLSPKTVMELKTKPGHPLPENGVVCPVTTRDGYTLRSALWAVPGFTLEIGRSPEKSEAAPDQQGEAEPQEAGAADNGNGEQAEESPPASGESDQTPPQPETEAINGGTNQAEAVADEAGAAEAVDSDAVAGQTGAETDAPPEQDKADSEAATGAPAGKPEQPQEAAGTPTAEGGEGDSGAASVEAAAEGSPGETAGAEGAGAVETGVVADVPSEEIPTVPEDVKAPDAAEDADSAAAATGKDEYRAATVPDDDAIIQDEAVPAEQNAESPSSTDASESAPDNQPASPNEASDEPEVPVSGTVVLLQGRAEFIEKYGEVIDGLLERRFCVAALDWRGQGGSERIIKRDRRKGHVDHVGAYVDDLVSFLDFLDTTNLPRPFYCLAHSTGGQAVLQAAPVIADRVRRAVITAPYLRLAASPLALDLSYRLSKFLTYIGFGRSYVLGTGATATNTEPHAGNPMTSDPVRYKRTADFIAAHPEVGLGGPTYAWVYRTMRAGREIQDQRFIAKIGLPVLFLTASEDRIVSSRASADFAEVARTVSHLGIPGARHEIMMERDEVLAQFWAAFDAFVPSVDTVPVENLGNSAQLEALVGDALPLAG